ncbi:glucanase B [Phyllosticta citricarpa]|uniref:Glucanase B n=1 Tax=Phyllosticta citricarpa TaxID=55181 RepID=A0ABR1M5F4_9PEZI
MPASNAVKKLFGCFGSSSKKLAKVPPVPTNRPVPANPSEKQAAPAVNLSNKPNMANATATTLDIGIVNKTNSSTVYAYITGRALDNNNALFLLQSDGKTAYYPTSPSNTQTALSQNCSIPLGAPGSTTTVTIPHLAGARIWFCIGEELTFLLNPGPALVEPSVTNPTDPSIRKRWDFAEFTWNTTELYANITYVDFVSIPIALDFENTSGATSHVAGMDQTGLDTVCSGLQAQSASDGQGWSSLIVKASDGSNLRALSPNDGIITNSSLFSGYYDSYVDAVWNKYSSDTLNVDTQASYGVLAGKVSNGVLTVGSETFAKPSAADIFSNSTGPFANPSGSVERNAIIPRLAAAFNRSTFLVDTNTPAASTSDYYTNPVTNHYSRIVHDANLDKRGYAFPYDDVAPSGGSDQSGAVYGAPKTFTVTVGGNGATA